MYANGRAISDESGISAWIKNSANMPYVGYDLRPLSGDAVTVVVRAGASRRGLLNLTQKGEESLDSSLPEFWPCATCDTARACALASPRQLSGSAFAGTYTCRTFVFGVLGSMVRPVGVQALASSRTADGGHTASRTVR